MVPKDVCLFQNGYEKRMRTDVLNGRCRYLNPEYVTLNVGWFLYTYRNLMVYITAKHHWMVKPFLKLFLYVSPALHRPVIIFY